MVMVMVTVIFIWLFLAQYGEGTVTERSKIFSERSWNDDERNSTGTKKLL